MKQSGCIWNCTINAHIVKLGFTHLTCKYCIYYRETDKGTIIASIHVDNFAIVASTPMAASHFKDQMCKKWQISDLGEAAFCIGIAISRDHTNYIIAISQIALIDRIISQFGLTDAHPATTPMDPNIILSR